MQLNGDWPGDHRVRFLHSRIIRVKHKSPSHPERLTIHPNDYCFNILRVGNLLSSA
jgi:hypothetical protein